MEIKPLKVGRPPNPIHDDQLRAFMDALDNRHTLNQARAKSGITQRQLERLRRVEWFDFFIRLRLEHYRHYTLPGADAAMTQLIEEERLRPPCDWREWEELKPKLDRLRAVDEALGVALGQGPETEIPPAEPGSLEENF